MRKRKKNLKRLLGYSMMMGGAGLIGGKLPPIAGTPVTKVASVGSAFVSPMASVTGASYALESLKKLKPKRKKRRNK